MIQLLLPIVPQGSTSINDIISVVREDDEWTYYCSLQPLFGHQKGDLQSFRMITAQLCCRGACTQAQIVRVFGVSKNSVLRSVKKYREEGIESFYRTRKRRGQKIMTAEVTARAQKLLDKGYTRHEVAEELGIKYDTLRKAIKRGQVKENTQNNNNEEKKPVNSKPSIIPSDKSSRSVADAEAGSEMGWFAFT